MLDGSAVLAIAQLAQEALAVEPQQLKIGEHVFTTTQLHHLPPKPEYGPTPLQVGSLQALCDYLEHNRDNLDRLGLTVLVASPTRVDLIGPITGESADRFLYLRASAQDLAQGFLGQYHEQVIFAVGLQSRFQDMGDRAEVLQLVHRIKREQSLEEHNDGVTQSATVRQGVSLSENVQVPNPVSLAPYRTFREIEDQPPSQFVLRVDSQGRAALFEADGGAWQLDAVLAVARWLLDRLPIEIPVIG